MCGISGIFTKCEFEVDTRILAVMSTAQRHRGPDEHSVYSWGRCALAHERLAIIDVAGGGQPILNEDGSCGLVTNGEIYNYKDLSRELEKCGHRFRSQTDSEVILHGYEEYGCGFFNRLDGMFSLAIWDGQRNQLVLARDGLGKKPLAYSWVSPDTFSFASDIRALRKHPLFDHSLNPQAMAHYLLFRCVSDPESIFSSISKVPPGSWMIIKQDGAIEKGIFWTLPEPDNLFKDYDEAKQELRRIIRSAVAKRLMSERPLGILLSSGIDSSIVTAEAAVVQGGIHTFTLGFEGQNDERPMAKKTAAFFKTEHREQALSLNPEKDLALAESVYDEPFADSSFVATSKICQIASNLVTVVLTGDGGDESFAGYNHLRHFARSVMVEKKASANPYYGMVFKLAGLLPRPQRAGIREKLQAYELARKCKNRLERWFYLNQVFSPSEILQLMKPFTPTFLNFQKDFNITEAESHDYLNYLRSDLLVKMDRASMGWGLEARSPFLDDDLIRFSRRLPWVWKIDAEGRGKKILRETYGNVLPSFVWEQPKRGFQSPVKFWLKTPFFLDQIRYLESSREVNLWNHVDAGAGRRIIRKFLQGAGNEQQIWSLLILERWLQNNST